MDRTKAASRGYILAMLLAIIVAMGILLTAALPSLTAEVQRDQEAELIYRGEHIANGIVSCIEMVRLRSQRSPLKKKLE